MGSVTQLFRICRIISYTLLGLLIAALVFPLAAKPLRLRLIQWWSGRLLAAFNLHIVQLGTPPDRTISNTMFVANHISWADIHALNSLMPLRFIAKSEIRSWPVLGYLASKANVFFIDREKRQHAARTVKMAATSLLNGDNLCLFPEGTTTDGSELRPFKSSLIEAAIAAKAILWPVAIRYPNDNGGINTDVAYAGETTLIESIQQVLKLKSSVIELHFLAPIDISTLDVKSLDRRHLTLHVQTLIQQQLGL